MAYESLTPQVTVLGQRYLELLCQIWYDAHIDIGTGVICSDGRHLLKVSGAHNCSVKAIALCAIKFGFPTLIVFLFRFLDWHEIRLVLLEKGFYWKLVDQSDAFINGVLLVNLFLLDQYADERLFLAYGHYCIVWLNFYVPWILHKIWNTTYTTMAHAWDNFGVFWSVKWLDLGC